MDRSTEDSAISPEDDYGVQDQSGNTGGSPETTDTPDPDPATKKFIEDWTSKIKRAKKHHEDAFRRMRKCMKLAKNGHSEEWGDEKFTTPIIMRWLNQSVAQLYAKNPTALAKRKRRRMSTIWDGTLASLNEAEQAIQAAAQTGMPPDPTYIALAQDVEKVKQYNTLANGIADTLTLLTQHFVEDPAAQYKQQFKSLVRRARVCGVGYVKLSFQRMLEQDPDVAVKISNASEQLATLRQLLAEKSREEIQDDSGEEEQLKTLLADLQSQEYLITREGPLFTFPKPMNIIIDHRCYHLKTLAGAGWYAEEYEKTPEEIERIYKVNVKGNYTQYKPEDNRKLSTTSDDGPADESPGKVWRVMNRETGQEFTICEGYPFYLKEPAAPEVSISRFWDIFPLVFNEIEDEKDIYPPSDVWNARHIQNEYNRAREGLREHRQINRPAYVTPKGAFEETDLDKFNTHSSGEILTMNQLAPGEKIGDKLQAKPVMEIDPKLYDVTELWNDMLRALGTQQADMGPTTKATATESSIAEAGRTASQDDLVDDIDDMLSLLFQGTGELMLKEMSPNIVTQIVGPGAVWPTMPQTREQIAEEIILGVKGGSSGRPNQAADLAKMERAMPFVIQIPGFPPQVLRDKYLDLLDMDIEDDVVDGLPSIVALNGMLSKMNGAQPGTGNPATDPNQQGPQGAQNAPKQPGTPHGPQPGYPAPTMHFDHQGNPVQ